jgi:phosphatidylethanolamine/phosphatidyl-N-methylethanolamine N-methyltransferase
MGSDAIKVWLDQLFFQTARQRAIHLLRLKTMERLLVIGVGNGHVFPLLPPGLWVTGVDSNPSYLQAARKRTTGRYVTLELMDIQSLQYPDRYFDAVFLNLVFGNASDGPNLIQEAWRVIRPGGRLVILDSFLSEDKQISPVCRWFGQITTCNAIRTNWLRYDLIGNSTDMVIERKVPGPFNGWYQILLIRKEHIL